MITAQVVLINKDKFVLGVSRKTDHNDFGLCGGKMEDIDNGNPMATAIRETFEETGLRIFDLQLIFAIHKNGNMGYTYLANYEGEINHNEPHVVKWVPFDILIQGSFGKYNRMVSESLDDMGIKYVKRQPPKEKYLFAISKTDWDDNPWVCIVGESYWKKNKELPDSWDEQQREDIDAICENGNIEFGEKDEFSYDVFKNKNLLILEEDIKKAMEDNGFHYSKAINNYLNN